MWRSKEKKNEVCSVFNYFVFLECAGSKIFKKRYIWYHTNKQYNIYIRKIYKSTPRLLILFLLV